MPFTLNQGCFCCNETASSSDKPQAISRQSSFTSGANNLSPAQNNTGGATEIQWLQNASHRNSDFYCATSQPELNHVISRHDTFDEVSKDLEMCQISDSDMSFKRSAVTSDHRRHNSLSNLHMLQNRELGSKIQSIKIKNGMKPMIALTAPVVSLGQDIRSNMVVSANSADNMDLDSALDELGMLSTVTNSRKQYLLETQGHISCQKHEHRLHSKSESYPNLTLFYPNVNHVVQTSDLGNNQEDTLLLLNRAFIGFSKIPRSELTHVRYHKPNNFDDPIKHHRPVPRMSLVRKDRLHRRSSCPYQVPHRLYSIIQDSSWRSEHTYPSVSLLSSSVSSVSDPGVDTLPNGFPTFKQLPASKSNTTSPVKTYVEAGLTRSLSAEDLAPICRQLDKELKREGKESSHTEQNMDLMTSQMTNLHMS